MQKQAVIILRTTTEQKELLKKKAITRETTLSNYLLQRALIDRDLTAPEKDLIKSLMVQTRQIGVNLNQVAKNLNLKSHFAKEINQADLNNLITQVETIKNNYVEISLFIEGLL